MRADDTSRRASRGASWRAVWLLAGLGGGLAVAWAPSRVQAQSAGAPAGLRVTASVGHASPVTSLRFGRVASDPERPLLLSAAGDRDREARAWDPVAQRLIASQSVDASPVAAVAVDSVRRRLVLASRDGTVHAWYPADDRIEPILRDTMCAAYDAAPHLVLTRDALLFACGSTLRVRALNSATRATSDVAMRLPSRVTAMAVDAAGAQVAVGDVRGDVHLLTTRGVPTTFGPPTLLGAHAGAVLTLAWSPDGRQLLSGSTDYEAVRWTVATGATMPLRGHRAPVVGVAFDGTGAALTVASDGAVRRWTDDGAGLETFEVRGAAVTSAALDVASGWLATGHADGAIHVWDLAARGRSLGALGVLVMPTQDLSLVDGEAGEVVVASVDDAGQLATWSLMTGRPVLSSRARPWILSDARARLAAAGPTLATLGEDGGVRILHDAAADAARLVAPSPDGMPPRVRAGLSLVADASQVLAVRDDGALLMWDVSSGRFLNTFDPLLDTVSKTTVLVTALASDARGEVIVRGLSDGRVRVFDRRRAERATTVGERGAGISAVSVSTDGHWIAVASADGDVRIMTSSSLEVIASWRHPARVARMVMLADASPPSVLVGSVDGRLCLYRASARACATFAEPDGVVPPPRSLTSMAVSADGRWVVTAGSDAWTRVWRVADRNLAYARAAVDPTRWLVIEPGGRFDGSSDALRDLHYRRGLETVALERFLSRDFAPGLATRALSDVAAPPGGARVRLAPPSLVATVVAGDSSSRLLVVMPPTEDTAATETQLHHNGVGLARLSRSALCPAGAACYVASLVTGQNVFEATRRSSAGEASQPARLVISQRDDGAARPRTLHVLALGIDAYPSPDRLSKATRDARDVVRALARRGARSFARVTIDTLFDQAASEDAIDAAFARAAALQPDDVFVFLFVGHGLVGDDGHFGLATFAPSLPLAERTRRGLSDGGAARTEGLLSEATLYARLLTVPSLHKVVLLDACRAGTAVAGLGGAVSASVASEQAARRSWSRLGSDGGLFVVGAAGADQAAFEGPPDARNGVFATTLLDALSGDGDETGTWTIRALITSLERRLPLTARRFGTPVQTPVVWTLGRDFPLFTR